MPYNAELKEQSGQVFVTEASSEGGSTFRESALQIAENLTLAEAFTELASVEIDCDEGKNTFTQAEFIELLKGPSSA